MSCPSTSAAALWAECLGRLLSDKALRESFRKDAWSTLRGMGLSAGEAAKLAAMEPDQLEAQARTLVHKRWTEVRRILPRTVAGLGPAAAVLFEEHASRYWPSGHRRHQLDAGVFVQFLLEHGGDGVSALEANRIRFGNGRGRGCRIRVHWLPRREVGSKLAPGVQVLIGWGGRWWEWVVRPAV